MIDGLMKDHEFEFIDSVNVSLNYLVVKDASEESESYLAIEQEECLEDICLTFSDIVAMAKAIGVTARDL